MINEYLEDYKKGLIKEGLGIGCKLDDHIRFKKGSFNMILGRDNVGKTYWRLWYYLVLSVKYDLKWCVWSGENKPGQLVRDLIKIYTGKQFTDLSLDQIYRYSAEIQNWFTFVDNRKLYTYQDLLKEFEGDYNGCLIDPYTGLDRKYGHADNYEFLNNCRDWVNRTGITLDICLHPVTESGRGGGVYPKGHDYEGHLRRPYKLEAEGGAPFANRCDDYIVLHRLTQHETMWYYTQVFVDKIKDTETGGKQTQLNNPLMLDYNNGLGFIVEGFNPLKDHYEKGNPDRIQKKLEINMEFEKNNYSHDPESDVPF